MSLTQQYLLDVHRLARRGQAAPPAPGTHEARLFAAVYRRLRRTPGRRPRRDSADTPGSAGAPRERGAERPGRGPESGVTGRSSRDAGRGGDPGSTL